MAEQANDNKKLHIAMFPFLAFGHMIPFYELAKLIARKGHKVSFISTPRNIKRLPKLPSNLQPFLEFIELPLPHVENLPENAESTLDVPFHIVPYLKKAIDGLQEPLTKFLESSNPHFLAHSNSVEEIAKPIYDFLTQQNESGVTDAFRIKEIVTGAAAIAIRSCTEVEGQSLKLLESVCKKPVIPVGLLPPSPPQSNDDDNNGKDENWPTILKWLDEQEERSVIYVAFGSEVKLSDEEFIEIVMGLELSNCPYFWALKMQNSPNDDIESNNKRGIIWNNWAPQLKILAHKSIGGFLTHCGWSSIIESLQFGCPLILLPFQGEQELNAMVVKGIKVGVKVERNEDDGKFTRYSIAKGLRTMMLEEEGKSCRSIAEEKKSKIFGNKELHEKYIDEFVHFMEIHKPNNN
ncbi:hypothetical protein PIB30_034832 [Stylosanthes scabra]|uniref:Glycosyltransferase n=1 Tax=Stylosanthes scabra TaxID=79078 RepID=A0ABU6XAY6_9FABA|nr:hypothetical protein [Stylosanthes scabra]